MEEKLVLYEETHKEEGASEESLLASMPKSPAQNGKPTSMILKKANSVIPAHLVAEAISTLHGLDLRWSGPITPTEMQFVEQYVFAKYPQYNNGLIEQTHTIDNAMTTPSINEQIQTPLTTKGKSLSPKGSTTTTSSSQPFTTNHPFTDLYKIQLESSKLQDIIAKKPSLQRNFISIPEVQARNKALYHCGLTETETDYLVVFNPTYNDGLMMVAESYPFIKGNYYMTILNEGNDCIRDIAGGKETKVIGVPASWLDLRIKGSNLSQYFRRKCKFAPKGLFAYPASVEGTRYSMHWISEAHRNSWHVLLDATGVVFGEDLLALGLHRPDFVLCTLDNSVHAQPSKVTCLLVRRKSFHATL